MEALTQMAPPQAEPTLAAPMKAGQMRAAPARAEPARVLPAQTRKPVTNLSHIEIGRLGEELCERHLVNTLGFTLIERNWACTGGEADLIMDDGGDVVFVEVKTRLAIGLKNVWPEVRVDAEKVARYRRIISTWLASHPTEGSVRFWVAAVNIVDEGRAKLRYLPDIDMGEL